ncbi:MAG TPA: VWA domain-containing protein [Pyrinomonadaceae bacterium]|nr:VWA domain-containing protein [Pyrinomonadaceae bacterium]
MKSRPLLLLILSLVAFGSIARAQATNTPTPNPQTPNPAKAQTPAAPSQTPTGTPATTGTVRLNVIVTDAANRSVGDLRQEDFRVEEDGTPQTITQFAREELPVTYTLVVDNSGSLRNIFENMLRAGAALVAANKPGDETSLTRFVSADNISVMQDFTGNQSLLVRGLESMYIEGGQTAVIDAVYLSALRVAEQRDGDGTRRRALVLLSDGEDRASRYKQSELQKLLRKLDVQVFAIGVVSILPNDSSFIRPSPRNKATAFLNTLAAETGGRAFFPKNVKELQEAVGEIARDLRTQYTISYQPSNTNADGKFRKVQVKLSETAKGDKRSVHARAGYFAPGKNMQTTENRSR